MIALWAVYEGLLSQHSVLNLWKFRQQRDELRQELAEAEARRDDLKEKIALIENDEFALEKLAREKLGFVKEGEILYKYEDPVIEEGGEAPITPEIVDEDEESEGDQ